MWEHFPRYNSRTFTQSIESSLEDYFSIQTRGQRERDRENVHEETVYYGEWYPTANCLRSWYENLKRRRSYYSVYLKKIFLINGSDTIRQCSRLLTDSAIQSKQYFPIRSSTLTDLILLWLWNPESLIVSTPSGDTIRLHRVDLCPPKLRELDPNCP